MITRRNIIKAAGALAVMGNTAAMAQMGQQHIRLIVGFAPGGTTDMVARLIADKAARIMGQPIVVENRPGAGGRIAAQTVKQSPADGLTYMLAPNAVPVFQALLYPPEVLKMDYVADFEVVSMVTSFPFVFAVNDALNVKNVQEFTDWLKNNKQEASFGSAGAGGQSHFSGLRLGEALGTPMQVIPYKGNSAVVADMLGGRLPCAILPAGDVLPHLRSGRIRALAVFGDNRSDLLPEVPTFKEAGLKENLGGASWMAIWGNANAPKDKSQKLREAVKATLEMQEVKDMIKNNLAMSATYKGAEETTELQKNELAYWAPVIKASGFTPDV